MENNNSLMITVYKAYDTKDSTSLRFFDEITKKEIGYIIYGVYNEAYRNRVGKIDQIKMGIIKDAVIDGGYRGKGIISQIIPDILCDMKCKGAHIVKATDVTTNNFWDRFGFKAHDPHKDDIWYTESPKPTKYLTIPNMDNCECKTTINKFINTSKEDDPIISEKDCCKQFRRS